MKPSAYAKALGKSPSRIRLDESEEEASMKLGNDWTELFEKAVAAFKEKLGEDKSKFKKLVDSEEFDKSMIETHLEGAMKELHDDVKELALHF